MKNKVSHLSYLEITIIKLIEKVSINYYSVTKLSMLNYSSVTAEVNENFVNYECIQLTERFYHDFSFICFQRKYI